MSTLGSATVNLKKSPEMNMVDITQIINISSQKKNYEQIPKNFRWNYEIQLSKLRKV